MYYRLERNSNGYTHVFGDDLVNEMYVNDVPCLELAEFNMAVTKPEVVVTFDVFKVGKKFQRLNPCFR